VPLLLAAQSSHVTLFAALVGVGMLIGIYGHLTGSRTAVVVGIVVIAAVSAYFSFVLRPSGG
jgi:hypothetical protein